jgi:hypothetical protein
MLGSSKVGAVGFVESPLIINTIIPRESFLISNFRCASSRERISEVVRPLAGCIA